MRQIRHAFTMLELVFVIAILGIVASVGASIIAQTFETYMMQRAVHSASIKTELAINQIANRLTYYMRDSLLARVPGDTDIANAIPLANVPASDTTHNMLEWIGYDNDGFTAQTKAHGWSGVCDLGASDFEYLITPASKLKNGSASESTILGNLFPNMANPAVRFLTASYRDDGTPYTTTCMYGTGETGNGCMFPVTITGDNTLKFTGGDRENDGHMLYSEFYQLAGSAYAIVPSPRDINGTELGNTGVYVWDLMLHYDYQPWKNENYRDNGTPQLLAHNVSVFRFRQEGNTVRIKLCTVEQIGDTDTISICKEKAVLR